MNPEDIQNLTDTELKEELKQLTSETNRRIEIQKERERQERKERNQVVLDNIDVFLKLKPRHSRSSCSDEHLNNARHGCTRCMLLVAKRDQYIDDDYYPEFEFIRGGYSNE